MLHVYMVDGSLRRYSVCFGRGQWITRFRLAKLGVGIPLRLRRISKELTVLYVTSADLLHTKRTTEGAVLPKPRCILCLADAA